MEILAWFLTDTDFPIIRHTNYLVQHDFKKSIQSTSDISYTVGLNMLCVEKEIVSFYSYLHD